MVFTARQVTHYWNGESKPNNMRFETKSLMEFSTWLTMTVKYWEGELMYGPREDIQSCTIETGAGMPDIGIIKNLDGSVEVTEINPLY